MSKNNSKCSPFTKWCKFAYVSGVTGSLRTCFVEFFFWFGTGIFILMDYMAVTKLVSGYRGEAKAWHQMADHRLPSHVSIHWNPVVCFWFNNYSCAFFIFFHFFFCCRARQPVGSSRTVMPSSPATSERPYGATATRLARFLRSRYVITESKKVIFVILGRFHLQVVLGRSLEIVKSNLWLL